jgi:hypothetical protein
MNVGAAASFLCRSLLVSREPSGDHPGALRRYFSFVLKSTGLHKIFTDSLPFVENGLGQALLLDGFGEAVLRRLTGKFFLKCAENAVPDDKAHAHVLVEILNVARVVHAVVRGRYENVFQPAQFAYVFGMNDNAVNLCDGVHYDNVSRVETDQCKRNEIDETIERLKYRRAEAGGQVEMLRRVVRHMNGPEQTTMMVHIMQGVKARSSAGTAPASTSQDLKSVLTKEKL